MRLLPKRCLSILKTGGFLKAIFKMPVPPSGFLEESFFPSAMLWEIPSPLPVAFWIQNKNQNISILRKPSFLKKAAYFTILTRLGGRLNGRRHRDRKSTRLN